MTDKPSTEPQEEVTDSGIPASVIAQAEAAIIGEFNDNESIISRRPSRVPKPDYSQYQGVNRAEGSSK